MDGLLDASAQPAAADARDSPRDRGSQSTALFSGLSQELCRPLISLRAGVELLLAGGEGPVSNEQRVHLEGLRGQCDEMIRLTRTFLDYAGLTHSSRAVEKVPFRLGALVDETHYQFHKCAIDHEIKWECVLDGDDATVDVDLDCFQQILSCIVQNAFSHTPTGGCVTVVASLDERSWRVVIDDDGPGIPESERERVFEPLVRLSVGCNARQAGELDSRPGLGMGLAVSRELVHLLDGTISLEALPETGTRVVICFPRHANGM